MPISQQQIQVINRTLDALQEEVAAGQSPSVIPLLLFVLSLLLPLAGAFWLLLQAERSVIGADQTIRTLVQTGFTEPVLHYYLQQESRRALPGGQVALPQRVRRRRRARHRHRHRTKPTKEDLSYA